MGWMAVFKLAWKPVLGGILLALIYVKVNGWVKDYEEMKQAYDSTIATLQVERNNARIEAESAKATIEEMEKNEERLELLLADALERQDEIRAEANRQREVFEDHDFTKLTQAKPGLIERLANKATNERMNSFEDAFND